jgi:hypothetical protein
VLVLLADRGRAAAMERGTEEGTGGDEMSLDDEKKALLRQHFARLRDEANLYYQDIPYSLFRNLEGRALAMLEILDMTEEEWRAYTAPPEPTDRSGSRDAER